MMRSRSLAERWARMCVLRRVWPVEHEHMNLGFPGPVALPLEDAHSVTGTERLLTVLAHQLHRTFGQLVGVLAVRAGLDDIEGVVPDTGFDPRFPELLDRFGTGDRRRALEEQGGIGRVER